MVDDGPDPRSAAGVTAVMSCATDHAIAGVSGSRTLRNQRLGCAVMAEIRAEITANVWQVLVEEGQMIAEGDEVCILESMKMEIPVITETPGVVRELYVVPEQVVQEGALIALIDES